MKRDGERAAFRDWGFGAVAIGTALQDGPLSVSGRFAKRAAMVARRSLYLQENAVYDDFYFQKSAVLGDIYLRKSAELG